MSFKNEQEIKNEVERQYNILKRGCEEIINEHEFKKKLEKSISTDTPLRVKLGIDPTGSELHLGHAVPLRKLKQFQDLGHEVLFLIGTFTGRIGDPTGKSETRKMLSEEQVKDWLEKLALSDALNLLSQFTVSQMISREDFSKRLAENKPVSLIEFMYPILQGYDSVELKADIELGATEQKFNLLRGRDLQKNFGQEQQVCMIMPILVGLDGVEKMSKSLGNYIGVKDTPNDMFGKVMSISDELMENYYTMITDVPSEKITEIKAKITDGSLHPMEAKKQLGAEVVKIYYGEDAAKEARDWFENVFSKKNLDVDLPEVEVEYKETGIIDLLVKETKLMSSTSEARRLIEQGGFKINDGAVKDVKATVVPESGMIIRAGKKKIVKVK